MADDLTNLREIQEAHKEVKRLSDELSLAVAARDDLIRESPHGAPTIHRALSGMTVKTKDGKKRKIFGLSETRISQIRRGD